jgi:hypothetical protein
MDVTLVKNCAGVRIYLYVCMCIYVDVLLLIFWHQGSVCCMHVRNIHSFLLFCKQMSESGPPARPMKYPYTFSAKIAQFPLKYYFQNQWIWRYYFIAVAVCAPVFYSISRLGKLIDSS